MNKTNYISIKSVLFDLSTLLEDRYYNQAKMLEWAVKGYQSLKLEDKFIKKVFHSKVDNHKVQLPIDLKFILMVALKDKDRVRALVPASTQLTMEKCLLPNTCHNCKTDYTVDHNLVLTLSSNEGDVYVEYLAYPTEDGEFLIPDHEDVKEAIVNYILWKYWLSKSLMKEQGADNKTEYFRNLYVMYSNKALSLSMPDVGQMENIKRQFNSLVPKDDFSNLFVTLNNQENGNS